MAKHRSALERMVGRQALEIEFLKGALRDTATESVCTSVITPSVRANVSPGTVAVALVRPSSRQMLRAARGVASGTARAGKV